MSKKKEELMPLKKELGVQFVEGKRLGRQERIKKLKEIKRLINDLILSQLYLDVKKKELIFYVKRIIL